MDNSRIDVVSEGKDNLSLALKLAFGRHTASHYYVSKNYGLVFFWTKPDSLTPKLAGEKSVLESQNEDRRAHPIPFKLNAGAAVDFAWNWLEEADYGSQPDHDGDNGKGWRVFNESWGQVADMYQAFVAIQPRWAMYGK